MVQFSFEVFSFLKKSFGELDLLDSPEQTHGKHHGKKLLRKETQTSYEHSQESKQTIMNHLNSFAWQIQS